MTRPRTLAIGLDGYEPAVADALMAQGHLPSLARLRERGARFALDHGAAKQTGLAWEHVSLGRSPQAAGRYSAVSFDPARYEVRQCGTSGAPVFAVPDLCAVIFDAPYFDLSRAPNCRGLVHWGAHDAGVDAQCAPASLAEEVRARFGEYPATPWIYGFAWPDPRLARAMGESLVRAVETRAAVSRWLLAERLPEWDLALLVVSELHSALEALWHGIDPGHPLHACPSSEVAREGVLAVYAAVDRLVGSLCTSFPDARLVVFSMHGMGPNRADLPSMLLLPELLHRAHFGRSRFVPRAEWLSAPDGVPRLAADETWSRAVLACLAPSEPAASRPLRERLRRVFARRRSRREERVRAAERLEWMPASHYQPFWSRMDAFALPSFYDGRVRINLRGRERRGRVAPRDYAARCDALCELIRACRDPRTGEPVVADTLRPVEGDPLAAGPTQADLVINWRGSAFAFEHPTLGLVGPAPCRRTGGHTGGHGVAYLAAPGLEPGDHGVRSAFDVVPTLFGLCGVAAPEGISGKSLLPASAGPAVR